jgi:hypothetical protein
MMDITLHKRPTSALSDGPTNGTSALLLVASLFQILHSHPLLFVHLNKKTITFVTQFAFQSFKQVITP